MNSLKFQFFFTSAKYQMLVMSLAMLLQRSPIARIAGFCENVFRIPMSRLLQLGTVIVAAAETQHAVTGATTFSTNPTSPAIAKTGEAFDMVFAVTGAPGNVASWRVTGSLPPGLALSGLSGNTLNSRFGSITGTPTSVGSYDLTLKPYAKTNLRGDTTSFTYSLTITVQQGVVPTPVTVFTATPSSNGAAEVGTPYQMTFSVSGMTPKSWKLVGALPDGLTLTGPSGETTAGGVLNAASGVVSGTPTTVGASSFTVQPFDQLALAGLSDEIQHALSISVAARTFSGPYQQWKFDNLQTIDTPDGTDLDRDGYSILLEYALGLSPNLPDSFKGSTSRILRSADQTSMQLNFDRFPARNDVNIYVEGATELTQPWVSIASSLGGEPFSGTAKISETTAPDGSVRVAVEDDPIEPSQTPRFLRIRVSK